LTSLKSQSPHSVGGVWFLNRRYSSHESTCSTAITASKYASKELKQLGNALFDLHCALNHLEKTANKILPRVLSGLDKNGAVGNSLHSMIDSCASTLNELDEAIRKYRDIDAQAEIDKPALLGLASG
jgi:hypothetical protein